VTVDADGIGHYSQGVEAAVYFCCLEALQNIQKYAQASKATIRLREHDEDLRFEIEDDGTGFDVATTRKGAGVSNMVDRFDALGGEVHVTSAVGQGTRIAGWLRVAVAASA
jgi:signal transduction histidine kinase